MAATKRYAANPPLKCATADLVGMAMVRIDAELRESILKSRMRLAGSGKFGAAKQFVVQQMEVAGANPRDME